MTALPTTRRARAGGDRLERRRRSSRNSATVWFDGDRLGEIVVDRRELELLDLLQRDGEDAPAFRRARPAG